MSEPLEYVITRYPEPVLRQPADPVEAFDEKLKDIVQAMLTAMRRANGVGLAAPQVGLKRRILVFNPTGEEADDVILVNSEILDFAGPRVLGEEGCLSFPEIYGEILRRDRVRVRAQDLDGEAFEAEYEGFPARIVQHEQDHLEGVLLVDRMSPADKLRNKIALENLVEDYKAARARGGA